MNLKKTVSMAMLACSLCSLPPMAVAAETLMPTKATHVAPVHDWTGFYAGVNAGFGRGSSDTTLTPNATLAGFGPYVPSNLSTNPSGFIGGGQVGYNYQFGSVVAGLEADVAFSGLKKNETAEGLGFIGGIYTLSAETKLKWFGTVRGRLGVVPVSNLLLYATGGFAYGRLETTAEVGNLQVPCVFAECGTGSTSGVSVGWTVGGGLEYALAPHVTLKAEYLYLNLGNRTVTFPSTANVNGAYTATTTDFHANLGRVGVNYRF